MTESLASTHQVGAVILAGGNSRRMGTDKAVLKWNGRRAIDRLANLVEELQLTRMVVAGRNYGLPFVLDPFPEAGPVAGVVAGVEALRELGCDAAIVLAVDAPLLAPEDLSPLLAAVYPGAVYEGLPLPMTIAFQAMPKGLSGSAPLNRLAQMAGLATLACPDEARIRIRGANNPEEREMLLAVARETRQ